MPGYPNLNGVPLNGQHLAACIANELERLAPLQRAEFLQQEEGKARRDGDLEMLRAIKEWRANFCPRSRRRSSLATQATAPGVSGCLLSGMTVLG